MSRPEPQRVLVLKPSSLGDIVHTLPAVARLRATWPQARISWLVNPEWAPLLEANPCVDEAIIFPRRELGGHPLRILRWVRELRARHRADLVLDFQGLLRSALIGRACRAGQFLGLSDAREGARYFYDATAPVAPTQHAVERYLALATLAGAGEDGPLQWPLPPGEAPQGECPSEPFLLLHPFSRGKGKSLSIEDVRKFCEAFPHPVVLAGRADVAAETVRRLPNVVSFLNTTTLGGLLWLLRRAAFVVSVDSGPMHLAAALGRPLLSIHTWSDPTRVGPYRPDAWIWRDRTLCRVADLHTPHPKPQAMPDLPAMAHWVATQMPV